MLSSTPLRLSSRALVAPFALLLTAHLIGCGEEPAGVEPKSPGQLDQLDITAEVAASDGKADEAAESRFRGPIECGQSRDGELSRTNRHHVYTVVAGAGQTMSVRLGALDDDTDPLLGIYAPDGRTLLAVNDDFGGTLNSFIELELPEDGQYYIVATTYGRRGEGHYRLGVGCTGLGRMGDPCATSSQCNDELFCAIEPFAEEGECRLPECETMVNSCSNSVCVAFEGAVDGSGFCYRTPSCDDGEPILCRRMIPRCEEGTILAYQGNCYACVDPNTCEEPGAEPTCEPTGCSGQACASEPVVTTCDMRPEYRCLQDCQLLEDGCGWHFEPGGESHQCLLDLDRCVFDEDCAGNAHCNAQPGWFGDCVPDDNDCFATGCFGSVCADAPLNNVICPAFVPDFQECVSQSICARDEDDVCAWSVEHASEAHECFLSKDYCAFDGDCASGQTCALRGGSAFGKCEGTPDTGLGDGEACESRADCADGLGCFGIADGYGFCRSTARIEGEGDDCSTEAPCGPGLICGGIHHGGAGYCVAEWMGGTFTNDNALGIPDNDPEGVSSAIVVRGLATVPTDIVLDVTIRHTWRGDLRVTLTDPGGQTVVVWDRAGSWADDLELHVPVNGFSMDDRVNGTWVLNVADHAGQDVGALENWEIYVVSRWD